MFNIILNLLKALFTGAPTTPVAPAQPVAGPTQPIMPKEPVAGQPVAPTEAVSVGLDYQLSTHFTFGQLTKTDHREYIDMNHTEGQKHLDDLALLCKEVLEPVWELMGSLFILSGFRCLPLNTAIGSKNTSQHAKAQAADTEYQGASEGRPLRDAYNKIMGSNIMYSQLIFEFEQWIHIGRYTPELGKKRENEITSTQDGKTVYLPVTAKL